MFKRDELGIPSFWLLQLCGWTGFYLWVMVPVLTTFKVPGLVRANTIWFLCMFAASLLLRPFCRTLIRRTLPWIALEGWAFVCSFIAGGLANKFLRIHLSRIVRAASIVELRGIDNREYLVKLRDGSEHRSSRTYASALENWLNSGKK